MCKECTEEELCCEFRRRPESLRILRSSARRASSKCRGSTEENSRTTERSVEKRLRQEGVEEVCR
jgi:hypothetical protein